MTKYKRWSKSAIECYDRGCKCKGCNYEHYFLSQQKCQMKYTVLELVRELGAPTNEERTHNI